MSKKNGSCHVNSERGKRWSKREQDNESFYIWKCRNCHLYKAHQSTSLTSSETGKHHNYEWLVDTSVMAKKRLEGNLDDGTFKKGGCQSLSSRSLVVTSRPEIYRN
jgi:hypothetical protein